MVDVSVCVVNWNAERYLQECLTSVLAPSWASSIEVIVVDNGSTDGSIALVEKRFPQVRLIANRSNMGFARANNRALEYAQGRLLMLLNNDAKLTPGSLDAMVRFADSHPDVGIVGCKVLNPDGTLQPSCRSFPSLPIMVLRALHLDKLWTGNRWTGANYMSYWNHDTVREVDTVRGCCMLVQRQMIQQVGMLDPSFFFYFEETDWCYRAKQAGWKTCFTPEAVIIHHGGQSTSEQSSPMRAIYYQSLLKYFYKHHGRRVSTAVRLCAIAEVGSRLAYWLLRCLGSPFRRELSVRKIRLYWPALQWLVVNGWVEPATLGISENCQR